ncbi:hypothetical protein HLB25_21820 [Dickeya dadantii]|uniref:hypothetical protein n=1 Tax=Dickeya dadantii TaxID=204038 RepID=UPI0014957357|nr:hypothetical protein [Dickeya dadantii]NPE57472.1 hypothetical protein [Dickeya dadantii]NPE69137.1 hypothetical protein [Dickeya dadantii]
MAGETGENGEGHGGMSWRMAVEGTLYSLAGYPSGTRMDLHRDISHLRLVFSPLSVRELKIECIGFNKNEQEEKMNDIVKNVE